MNVTRQEAFNIVWRGLQAQGWQKTGPWVSGMHSMERGGCRCAWGHLKRDLGQLSIMPIGDAIGHDSLQVLRECHDDATSPEDMQQRTRAFATKYCLAVPGEDDGFGAFMAKVREPLHESPITVTERPDIDLAEVMRKLETL